MSVKKLIEVALPMDAINDASAYDKMPGIGPHPKGLHQWWARLPLPSARVVLFASIIDDPSSHPDKFPTNEEQDRERKRLHALIRRMMHKHAPKDEELWHQVQQEILRATNGSPPPVLDPFCGGGSIPLEAQRLGLEAHASDLNPVAVLITKALIEIPPKFAGQPPVHSDDKGQTKAVQTWKGAQGLAEDVRYYGQWMRDQAENRIGHLYPKVRITAEMAKNRPDLKPYVGQELTVIAWLWARTVKCPNPACEAEMPLAASFKLSSKKGKEAWVEPIVSGNTYQFTVKVGRGTPPDPPKISRGANFKCICCENHVPGDHIKAEGMAGRMGARLLAIVAEGERSRVYLPPIPQHEEAPYSTEPTWLPDQPLAGDKRAIWCPLYGLDTFDKLFTPRQLVALTTLSDLVGEAREKVLADAKAAGLPDDGKGINEGGTGAQAYADAVVTYLGLGVSKLSDALGALARWKPSMDQTIAAFGRQALPMVWDYAESNTFSGMAGDYCVTIKNMMRVLDRLGGSQYAHVLQSDSRRYVDEIGSPLICTDPPYYDNIGYADLSDYFYVWLRRSLNSVFPEIFSTLLVPKTQELVASPYRFDGDASRAKEFFEEGLRQTFKYIHSVSHPDFPVSIYYAFKQAETHEGEDTHATASTGWETMLEGLLASGFAISGTWPMRTELSNRTIASGANALASSIVLACRPRPHDAGLTTRRDFIRTLKEELPGALKTLQQGNIAPVDLAQAAIGPGMAVFSRYSKVVEPDGRPMRVRTALQLINQVLDEVLAEQESEYDPDTRWALAWYEQHGLETGPFGDAETLSKAKDTAVGGLVDAGILEARGGKVRLLRRGELDPTWDPDTDKRMPVWEVTQHLCHALATGGEAAAAEIAGKVGALGEVARDLAYRLYTMCERKRWTQEALAYNSLVIAWPEIQRRVQVGAGGTQTELGL